MLYDFNLEPDSLPCLSNVQPGPHQQQAQGKIQHYPPLDGAFL